MVKTETATHATFEPVQAQRSFESVVEQIRRRVERGILRAGDKLPPERELSKQLKVSRHTLREALRSLEVTGLVEFRRGASGGAFIRASSGDAATASFADQFRRGTIRPEHLTEARIIIGVSVARLACERRTEEDLEALQTNVDESEAAVEADDIPRRARANLQFHRILATATRNPVLMVVTDAVVNVMEQVIALIGPAPNSMVMPSRRRLLEFIEKRDVEAAGREMEENLWQLRRFYLRGADEERK